MKLPNHSSKALFMGTENFLIYRVLFSYMELFDFTGYDNQMKNLYILKEMICLFWNE